MACRCQKCKAREANKVVTMPNGSRRTRCDCCGRGIPPYTLMQGSGFQSHTVDHEYMETECLGGREYNFFMPVHLELCWTCYLEDFALNYPDQPLPVVANVRDWEDVPQEIAAPIAHNPFAEYFSVTYA